ncbi:Thioredoxin domain-containing protein 15-like, partial [Homarus americanus]
WKEVTVRCLCAAWRPLWPECVLQRDFEGFEELEEEAVVHEIVALGNSMGLEVDDDDVEELVEEHSKELSTEELLELHKEENETLKRSLTSEESGEEEDKEESRIIPAKDLKDAFFCWSKLSKLAEDYHPDVGSVQKAISVFNDNVMNYFWKVEMQRQLLHKNFVIILVLVFTAGVNSWESLEVSKDVELNENIDFQKTSISTENKNEVDALHDKEDSYSENSNPTLSNVKDTCSTIHDEKSCNLMDSAALDEDDDQSELSLLGEHDDKDVNTLPQEYCTNIAGEDNHDCQHQSDATLTNAMQDDQINGEEELVKSDKTSNGEVEDGDNNQDLGRNEILVHDYTGRVSEIDDLHPDLENVPLREILLKLKPEGLTDDEDEANMEEDIEIINATALMKLLQIDPNVTSRSSAGPCYLVYFFSPYCPFSVMGSPYVNALARSVPNIPVYGLDSIEHHSVNARYGVMGTPTLLLFHNGNGVGRYNASEYSVSQLLSFVKHYTDQDIININVTSSDFRATLPSQIAEGRPYALWAAWTFLISFASWLFLTSELCARLTEAILNNWREAEAQNDHQD